jgi:iron complex outermembrane recepter protein
MKKTLAAAWLGSACLVGVTPALAQTAPVDGATEDVITVTARKREENLIDVPLPVSVATAAQLQRDQIYNVTDLQRITPALEVSQTSGGETNGGGRLRGLGTGVFNPSVAPSVALVVDQVPVGNLNFPQIFDLAQVEVLRGPQGTLFGQGASAGVINMTTVAPTTDRIKSSVAVDYANKGTGGSEVGELVLRSAINLPLGEQAAIRISGQYKRETGLQRSSTTGRDNVIEDYGLRVRALLKPSERVTVNLTGEYARETQDGQTFFAIAVAPNSTTAFGPPGGTLGGVSTGAFLSTTGCAMTTISLRAEQYCEDIPTYLALKVGGISGIVAWELNDQLTLTSVSGYRERGFTSYSRDFSRLAGAPAARQEKTQEDSRGFSQEVRLTYSGSNLDVVAGGYYNDFRFSRKPTGTGPYVFGNNLQGSRIGFSVCTAAGFFCPVPTSITAEQTSNRTLAVFTDATLKLGDQFNIFGGLRYSDYKNLTLTGVNTLAPSTAFTTTDSNLSGRIGVSYRPNASTNIYASYSRGYKPPAVGTNPAGALFQLLPESADTFELGAKFGISRFQVAANLFYTKLKNFQSQTSVFVGTALVSQPLNVPSLTSKGFELTIQGRVLPGLSVNGGYQYNDITFPTGYVGDDGGNLGGTQFLNAPKHKFTLSTDYAVPFGDTVEGFFNANLVYKSEVLLASRADPRYRFPGHELINLGIGIRGRGEAGWSASIFVRNLTKSREPTAFLANTFAGQADGGIRAWPVAGLTARVVGVRAGFDF